jgi:hypothetical protein
VPDHPVDRRGIGPRAASLLAVVLLALAACGAPSPAATPVPSAPTGPAPSNAPVDSAAPSIGGASSPASGGAVENPDLLAILPATVAGQPVVLERQAFADAIGDAAFATNIAEAAFGVVVAGDDLASAVVARPVADAYSEAWFRDWRESYDQGACAQAAGVAATSETKVDDRIVYSGTCAGGLKTYHTWLAAKGVLVSAFAVGGGTFGDELMAGLRP